MDCKVCLIVALIPYLMICELVRAQCTKPSFTSQNVVLSDSHLSKQNFTDGSTVTFQCETGHRPVNSRASKSVTCQRNQWTSLELECTKKTCGSLPDFDNGHYERTGNLFGDKITAVCNKGYVLDGLIKDRWCREDGWDGRDPVCEAVKCEAPPAIENGNLVDVPLDSYNYGDAVSYTCNKDLSLIGSSTLYCSEDGSFKPDPPKCVDGCPKPEILHATRIGGRSPPYKIGHFIDYKCDDGFTMKGDYHIVCGPTGWNPEPPKCIEDCSLPKFEGHHVILTEQFRGQNKFQDGTTVTFECIRGYEPVSSTVSKSITCVESKWTGLIFSCKSPPSTTTTTTTATTVTSKAQPKDIDSTDSTDSKGSPLSTTQNVFIGLGVSAGVLGMAILGYFMYRKKQSKHEYSEKVATKAQEEEL